MSGTSSSQPMTAKPISLKALVDKEKNRFLFVESNKDFVDILLSFLTMPLGTIIRLICNDQPPIIAVGCLNNLYASVENLDTTSLRTENCKKMLLYPINGAAALCKSLTVKIEDGELPSYYRCQRWRTHGSCSFRLCSYYNNVACMCGNPMNYELLLPHDGGGFVKEHARFLVTDKLQVMPSSTAAIVAIITKLGITNDSAVEERTFDIGATEVLQLLKLSLASEAPLTDILLQRKPKEEQLSKEDLEDEMVKRQSEEHESEGTEKISVRLVLSKSKQMVCYAEAGEDFVDLLLSFLTIPLGCMAKEIQWGHSSGSINHLYKSVQHLDAARCFKSNGPREFLLSPKIAPGFGYGNQPLGLQESSTAGGYTLVNPKSYNDPVEIICNKPGGFVLKPGMFMVTDNLIITSFSSFSAWSTLEKLKVPFSDIEERVVVVGNKSEAWRLFAACCTSESALTDAFIREE